MADVLGTDFDYCYDGKVATDVIYKPSVMTPEITQLFTVKTGIKYKLQLTLVGILDKIVKAYSGCTRSISGTGIDLTSCELEVKEVEFLLEQCKDAFESTVFGEFLPDGVAANELGPQIRGIIDNIIVDALRRDNFRILSFGDTTSLSADYNQLDGLWTKLIAGVATYCVDKIDTLPSGDWNDPCTYDCACDPVQYLKNLYEGANVILKQLPVNRKAFYVTGSVYEGVLNCYETQGLGLANPQMIQKDNSGGLMFRGIPIIPIYAWDVALLDTSNPLFGVDKLILYTTKENHFVGLAREADMGAVTSHFEWWDREYYFEGQYKMGYNYCHCDLQAVSYSTAN